MRNPPTKGQCHAVYLLIHVAGLLGIPGRDAWVAAARDRRTIAAHSFDLSRTADALVDWGFVRIESTVSVMPPLAHLGEVADYGTLKAIAVALLRRRPPAWLRAVVIDGAVRAELIPSDDLGALGWLGEDIEQVLAVVHAAVFGQEDGDFTSRLGLMGELAVLAALAHSGIRARHVSLISDAYGYDLECGGGDVVEGIEVKTAFPRTAERFHLSRNEFDISERMQRRWKIVQVVFSSRIVATGHATAADVESVKELSAFKVHEIAPRTEDNFRWTESAIFRPAKDMWTTSDLVIPDNFVFKLDG